MTTKLKPPFELPDFDDALASQLNGTATHLDNFIVDNEPAGLNDSSAFRIGLLRVILEQHHATKSTKKKKK